MRTIHVSNSLACSKPGHYPWPCEKDPSRAIEVFDDDVFTKTNENRYTMHTGLCKTNIQIPDELMVDHPDGTELALRMTNL